MLDLQKIAEGAFQDELEKISNKKWFDASGKYIRHELDTVFNKDQLKKHIHKVQSALSGYTAKIGKTKINKEELSQYMK